MIECPRMSKTDTLRELKKEAKASAQDLGGTAIMFGAGEKLPETLEAILDAKREKANGDALKLEAFRQELKSQKP